MKKNTIIILLLVMGAGFILIGMGIFTQEETFKGFDTSETILFKNLMPAEQIPYEKVIEKERTYSVVYPNTPVGYKHLVNTTLKICNESGLNFFEPNLLNEIFYPSNVKDLFDYSSMNSALLTQKAEIRYTWTLNNKILAIVCNKDQRILFVEK